MAWRAGRRRRHGIRPLRAHSVRGILHRRTGRASPIARAQLTKCTEPPQETATFRQRASRSTRSSSLLQHAPPAERARRTRPGCDALMRAGRAIFRRLPPCGSPRRRRRCRRLRRGGMAAPMRRSRSTRAGIPSRTGSLAARSARGPTAPVAFLSTRVSGCSVDQRAARCVCAVVIARMRTRHNRALPLWRIGARGRPRHGPKTRQLGRDMA